MRTYTDLLHDCKITPTELKSPFEQSILQSVDIDYLKSVIEKLKIDGLRAKAIEVRNAPYKSKYIEAEEKLELYKRTNNKLINKIRSLKSDISWSMPSDIFKNGEGKIIHDYGR